MSLALTKWNRGWYLCIEFRIVCNQRISSKSASTTIIIVILAFPFSPFCYASICEEKHIDCIVAIERIGLSGKVEAR